MDFVINLKEVINEKKLPSHKVLLPLFEAISNSTHAIEDKFGNDALTYGKIIIGIKRSNEMTIDGSPSKIIGFEVTDNGIGFTKTNLASFNTFRSDYKKTRGGKGFGRITYLRGFEQIKVQSIYSDNDNTSDLKYKSILFTFNEKGVQANPESDSLAKETGTKLILENPTSTFNKFINTDIQNIISQIFQDRLVHILTDCQPEIIVRDVNLDHNLSSNTKGKFSKERTKDIEISNFKFTIEVYQSYDIQEIKVHYCANNRPVESFDINKDFLDYFPKYLKDSNGNKIWIQVVVKSDFFDNNVSTDRSHFNFDKEGEIEWNSVKEKDLKVKLSEAIEELYTNELADVYTKNLDKVQSYIKRNPYYSSLLHENEDFFKKIPLNESEDNIENKFIQLKLKLEKSSKIKIAEARSKIKDESKSSLDEALLSIEEYTKSANTLNTIRLGEYILKRDGIINLLSDVSNPDRETNKYRYEDLFHALVFPLRCVGDDIHMNDHNLWIIDERLGYNKLLSSDLEFNKLSKKIDSKERPDLMIYNPVFGFGELDDSDCIYLVEFKRPGKENFDDPKYDPILQIVRYAEKIIEKQEYFNIKRNRIQALSRRPRFLGFIVCEINSDYSKKLKYQHQCKVVEERNTYIYSNSELNLYVEINSFDKVIKNNQQRLFLFMEALTTK